MDRHWNTPGGNRRDWIVEPGAEPEQSTNRSNDRRREILSHSTTLEGTRRPRICSTVSKRRWIRCLDIKADAAGVCIPRDVRCRSISEGVDRRLEHGQAWREE